MQLSSGSTTLETTIDAKEQARDLPMPSMNSSVSVLPDETLAFAEQIFDAARAGDLPLIKSAVEAGLPIELTNSSGNNLLMLAAYHGRSELVKFLLSPYSGNNLLMLAAYHGRSELVKFLLSRGAEVDRLNDRGQSALAGAIFKGWDEVVVALVEAGADIKAGQPNSIDCAYIVIIIGKYLRLQSIKSLKTSREEYLESLQLSMAPNPPSASLYFPLFSSSLKIKLISM